MTLFDNGRFDGSLAELIDRLVGFVPSRSMLAQADRWLSRLEESGRVLPIRKFKGRMLRGGVFAIGSRRFVPVDNESLAHLYRLLLSEAVPTGDFEDLYREGALTVSWKLDVVRTLWGPGVRTGQVTASFRDEGLKLAHLIDAARGRTGTSETDFVQRFRLSLNPLNCFPFPSPRRFRFEPLFGCADPGEAPQVQALLAAALAEHTGDVFHAYRRRTGILLADLPHHWRSIAEDVRVRFTLRRAAPETAVFVPAKGSILSQDVSGAIDSDIDAITPRGTSLQLGSLGELIEVLREWRQTCPDAERLHGHRKFLKVNRKTGKSTLSHSDPRPYVYFQLKPGCLEGVPDEAVRRWRLHGDTKAAAVDELIALYEAQAEFDNVFRMEATRNEQKLVLEHQDRSAGLYCYG